MGRFMNPDPIMLMRARLIDPQQWNMYAYARNNPLRFKDDNGEWSTEVHNEIIVDVFSSILSAPDLVILEQASHDVDQDQSMSGSYKHGMRAPWQTPEEANEEGDAFIDTKLNEAVSHQLDWDDLPGTEGTYSGLALYSFGEALHTVTDRESPWHDNDSVAWWGIASPTSLGHFIAETHFGPSQEGSISMAEYQAKVLWSRYQAMLAAARKRKAKAKKKEPHPDPEKKEPGKSLS